MDSTSKPSLRIAFAMLIGVFAGCISLATVVMLFDLHLLFGLGVSSESQDFESSTNRSNSRQLSEEDLQSEPELDTLVSLQQIVSRFERQVSLDRLLKSANQQRLIGILEASVEINNANHRTFIQTNLFRKLATKNPPVSLVSY